MALKGIEKVVARFCVETAVYWGNPQNDGYGKYTFDTPVEIPCRWENKMETDIGWSSTGFPGNIRLSKASVLVTQDLDMLGYLWRGTLEELEALYPDGVGDPTVIINAYAIHRVDRIPMVRKTDEFVRTVYLYDQGK